MTKDIKDYLHLYLGCEVVTKSGVAQLVVVGMLGSDSQRFRTIHPGMSYTNDWDKSNKIILRPLSDITEKEVEDLRFNMPGGVTVPNDRQALDITPHQVKYLLSLGFDLFNLIDEGLAIDKTTI